MSKKAKGQEGEAGVEVQDLSGASPKADLVQPLPNQVPVPSSFNLPSFPHILQRIIGYSSTATLSKLIRCDKNTFNIAIPRLYRNLRLPHRRFAHLIGAGTSDTISPSLLVALGHVRHLHLLGYDPDGPVLDIPQDSMKALTTLVIYSIDVPDPLDGETTALIDTTSVKPLNAPHLVIRIPAPFIESRDYTISPLPLGTRKVTFLAPFADHLELIPTLALSDEDVDRSDVHLTIVLLPIPDEDESAYGEDDDEEGDGEEGYGDWSQMFTSYPDFPLDIFRSALRHPVTLVGSEYLSTEPTSWTLRPREIYREAEASVSATPQPKSKRVIRVSFARWIRKQRPGVIFGKREIASMKRMDECTVDAMGDRGYVF